MNDTFLSILGEYGDETLTQKEIIYNTLKENDLDYSNEVKQLIFKKGSKYRKVLVTNNNSVEEISLKYLKKRLDSTFRISYPDRQKIMRECFSIAETINSVSDFVIYKFDFKDFFDSVKGRDVFNKYIKYSDLYRFEKDILEKIVEEFKSCSAGLPTSNALVELISKDFDIKLKSLLHSYGLIFYSRYVDDSLLIFNRYVEEDTILECIEKSISGVFQTSHIKLNKSKTVYLQSSSNSGTKFSYLGYLFEYKKEITNNKEKKFFKYGIADDKIQKYRKKLIRIIRDYKTNRNVELFRQRILFWTSRIVFYNTTRNQYSTRTTWDITGIVSTYGELRHFIQQTNKIESSTDYFLKNEIISQVNNELGFCPYFLKTTTSGYRLEDRLLKNRSIIFNPNIGWSKEYLIKMIKKIDPLFNPSKKSYRNMVTIYCDKLDI